MFDALFVHDGRVYVGGWYGLWEDNVIVRLEYRWAFLYLAPIEAILPKPRAHRSHAHIPAPT